MQSRVYVTVGRPSVRPSVCPVDRQQKRRAAGLLLSAVQAGVSIDIDIGRPAATAPQHGVQQQMRAVSRGQLKDEAECVLVYRRIGEWRRGRCIRRSTVSSVLIATARRRRCTGSSTQPHHRHHRHHHHQQQQQRRGMMSACRQ